MAKSAAVRDTDKGWSSLMALAGAKVTVEVGSSAPYAHYVHDGKPGFRPKPFLKDTFEETDYTGQFVDKLVSLYVKIGRRHSRAILYDHAERLGKRIAKDVKKKIKAMGLYLETKRSTGALYRSISSEMRKG